MPKTTHQAVVRSLAGLAKEMNPLVVALTGWAHLAADAGLATIRTAPLVPAGLVVLGARIITPGTTGTVDLLLPPYCAEAEVVIINDGSATTAAALTLATPYIVAIQRTLGLRIASGTAGQTIRFAVSVILPDDGRLDT